MATFQSAAYPALNVTRLDGSPLQFSGGVIEVEEADADRLRQVAADFPQYGITEVTAGGASDAESTESDEDEEEGGTDPTNDELREALRERGLPVSGNKDELILRLAESDAELEDDDSE